MRIKSFGMNLVDGSDGDYGKLVRVMFNMEVEPRVVIRGDVKTSVKSSYGIVYTDAVDTLGYDTFIHILRPCFAEMDQASEDHLSGISAIRDIVTSFSLIKCRNTASGCGDNIDYGMRSFMSEFDPRCEMTNRFTWFILPIKWLYEILISPQRVQIPKLMQYFSIVYDTTGRLFRGDLYGVMDREILINDILGCEMVRGLFEYRPIVDTETKCGRCGFEVKPESKNFKNEMRKHKRRGCRVAASVLRLEIPPNPEIIYSWNYREYGFDLCLCPKRFSRVFASRVLGSMYSFSSQESRFRAVYVRGPEVLLSSLVVDHADVAERDGRWGNRRFPGILSGLSLRYEDLCYDCCVPLYDLCYYHRKHLFCYSCANSIGYSQIAFSLTRASRTFSEVVDMFPRLPEMTDLFWKIIRLELDGVGFTFKNIGHSTIFLCPSLRLLGWSAGLDTFFSDRLKIPEIAGFTPTTIFRFNLIA